MVLCLVKEISQEEGQASAKASCVLDANLATVTDSEGRFEFREVPDGSYMFLYDDTLEDFEAGLQEWDGKMIKVGNAGWSNQFEDKEGNLPIDEKVLNEMLPSSNLLLPMFVTMYINGIEGFPFLVAAVVDTKAVAFRPVIVDVKTGETAEVNIEVFGSKQK